MDSLLRSNQLLRGLIPMLFLSLGTWGWGADPGDDREENEPEAAPFGERRILSGDPGDREELFRFVLTDTRNQAPLPNVRYRLSDPFGKPSMGWRNLSPDGTLALHHAFGSSDHRIEFDAPGYRSYFFEFFAKDPGEFRIRLSKPITEKILVINPDSSPASRAQVVVGLIKNRYGHSELNFRNRRLSFSDGRARASGQSQAGEWPRIVTTDTNGQAQILIDEPQFDDHMHRDPEDLDEVLDRLAFNDLGVGIAPSDKDSLGQPIQLLAWASLEGQLTEHGKPVPDRVVILSFGSGRTGSPLDQVRQLTVTDEQGRFRFKDFPPGPHTLIPTLPVVRGDGADHPWVSGRNRPVLLAPGKTLVTKLEINGYRLVGSVKFSEEALAGREYWLYLQDRSHPSGGEGGFRHFAGKGRSVESSSNSSTHAHMQWSYRSGETFELPDVPAGDYTLILESKMQPRTPGGPARFEPPLRLECPLEVKGENRAAGDKVDLGVLAVKRSQDHGERFRFHGNLLPTFE